tara:strand:+ start:159 stop:377 length:219 start_codon:yes stop_codon:yes gene_type:complete
MPINSPDVFCFQIKVRETNVTVRPQVFTDIGNINQVPGVSCKSGGGPPVENFIVTETSTIITTEGGDNLIVE